MKNEPDGPSLMAAHGNECDRIISGEDRCIARSGNRLPGRRLDAHLTGDRVPSLGSRMTMHRCDVPDIRYAFGVQSGVVLARPHLKGADFRNVRSLCRPPSGITDCKHPNPLKCLDDDSVRFFGRICCGTRLVCDEMPVKGRLRYYTERLTYE